MTATSDRSEGFSLIEALIAMLVMSVAVITIVSALSGMILSTQAHRGHAVAEASVRSFGQAAQARVQATTVLVGDIDKTTTSITVLDPTVLPGVNGYIAVDLETMRIVSRSGSTLTVARAQNDPTTAIAHRDGTRVLTVHRCPDAAALTPPAGSYSVPAGVTVTIANVEHWNGSTFLPSSACPAAYDAACTYDDNSGPLEVDVRQDCFGGLQRLTLVVSTAGDPRLRGVDATTAVLVRRASAA